jgi:curli biogenesis system outer membrane secretion channel CsgG
MGVATALALVPALAAAQGGVTKPKQGQGGSVVKGAAGTEGSKGDNGLEHCDKPMGAMAVVEPQSEYMMALSRYNLQSPVSLIRMMIQQSNCFIVVERGQGLRNMEQERALAGAGQTRSGSNMGGGQMVAADFIMTPQVVFSENNAGGIGGAAGGLLGGKLGAVAGGLKFKEAQTTLLVADSRSGVQVAAAEGSTKKADLRLGAGLFGGGGGASAGGYGNTNEGKIIAASFLDNYNKVVDVVRGDPSLQRNVGTLKQEAAGGGTRKAGSVFNEGDTLGPKIAGVKMYATPSDTGKVVATLGRADEMVVVGDEKDGYIEVETGSGKGWVRMTLVQKHQ